MNNSKQDLRQQANLSEMKQAMKLIIYKLVLATPDKPLEFICHELEQMKINKETLKNEFDEIFLTQEGDC